MNRLKIILVLLLTFNQVKAHAEGQRIKKFVLRVLLNKNENGIVYLYYDRVPGNSVADSAVVVSGRFKISGRISEPTLATLKFNNNSVKLYIEPARMVLLDEKAELQGVKLIGSATHDDFIRRKLDIENGIRDRNDISEKEILYINDGLFIINNPGSYYSLILLNYYFTDLEYASIKNYLSNVPERYRKTSLFKHINYRLKLSVDLQPGKTIPDILYTNHLGDRKSLYQSAAESELLLIDFWASWCIPCRKNAAYLNELYSLYNGKGLIMLSVSIEKDTISWRKAIQQDALGSWEHAIDTGIVSIEKKLGINSIPVMLLVDKNFRIVGRYNGRWTGNKKLKEKLNELLRNHEAMLLK